jgi:hypothetical protein
MGTTGWSVVSAISTPALARMPGLRSDRLRTSTFDRPTISGPMITGIPLSASRSAIR